MLEDMIRNLEKANGKELQIVAAGNYPDKKSTPVQHVAHYQNDGTPTIEPAHFVEKAETKNRGWTKDIEVAMAKHLDGDNSALEDLGYKISEDINKECKRIRTGRLKWSMVPKIK